MKNDWLATGLIFTIVATFMLFLFWILQGSQ